MDVMMVDRSGWDQSFLDSDFATRPTSTSPVLPSATDSVIVDDRLSTPGLLRCQQTAAWVAAAAASTGNDAAVVHQHQQRLQQQQLSGRIPSTTSAFYQNGQMVSVDSRRLMSDLQRSCPPLEVVVAPVRSSAAVAMCQSSPVSAAALSKPSPANNNNSWQVTSESSSSSSSSSSELGRLAASVSDTSAAPVRFDFQLVQTQSAGAVAVCPLQPSSSSGHLLDVDQSTTTTAVCRSSSSPNCFDDAVRMPSPSSLTGSPSSCRRQARTLAGDQIAPLSRDPTTSGTTAATAATSYSMVASFLPAWDKERLDLVYRRLAACGFYVGRMSVDEAAKRLARWPVGSFLLRDSSDRRYLFSVSVQTCRGTTSVRVAYRSGLFRLDCHPDQEHMMPTFDCALRLLRHYVGLCRRAAVAPATNGGNAASASPPPPSSAGVSGTPTGGHGYVLLETTGRRDTPVLLRTPYRERAPTLAHLCRLAVNRSVAGSGAQTAPGVASPSAVDRLQLLPSLKNYLKDYPYDI